MDALTTVVLLLIAFLAWSQDITWLFIGVLILLIISARSVGLGAILIAGVFVLYYFNLKEYWFFFLVIIGGIILILSERKPKAGGAESYSPELMKMLEGI